RADIYTEVTPFVGTEKQGEEFARYLTEEFEKDPGSVWNSDFLGKSLQDLVREGIQSKLHRMPPHAQKKLQETLTKIINGGSGGLICVSWQNPPRGRWGANRSSRTGHRKTLGLSANAGRNGPCRSETSGGQAPGVFLLCCS